MIETPLSPPWSAVRRDGDINLLFLGKGYSGSRSEAFQKHTGLLFDPAWAKQVHGAEVLDARPGACGEGDALVTTEHGLVVSVATADCVPVLLHDGRQICAVHAGWRGIVAGVITSAVERFDRPDRVRAWIGPTIGGCCYEVSPDVADQVTRASTDSIRRRGRSDRPHIDLVEAARFQLTTGGVSVVAHVELCTRCSEEALWSYRREGPRAGRNLAFAWVGPPGS